MNPKEEVEIGYLEKVLDNCPAPPTGAPRKCENPDFLLETAEGTLGIELTRIFMPGLLGCSQSVTLAGWLRCWRTSRCGTFLSRTRARKKSTTE